MFLIRRGKLAAGLLVAAAALLRPSAAHADAGIPMMPVRYPVLLLFLLPVIAIEAIYLQQKLRTRWRRTLVAVSGINILTMALGYPLAWGLYKGLDQWLGFEALGFQTPRDIFEKMAWLPVWVCTKIYPQWGGVREQIWPVLVAFVLMLVPSFVLSGLAKAALMRGYDLLQTRGDTSQETWAATKLSYLFLAASGCVLLYVTFTRM